MSLGVFADPEIDNRVCESSLFPQYLSAFRRRQTSHTEALASWMAGYEAEAKTPLLWLQYQKTSLENKLQDDPQNPKMILKLELLNDKINNGDYCLEDTPEFEYALSKIARRKEFNNHWPDSNEILLRQEEENNLLSQLP